MKRVLVACAALSSCFVLSVVASCVTSSTSPPPPVDAGLGGDSGPGGDAGSPREASDGTPDSGGPDAPSADSGDAGPTVSTLATIDLPGTPQGMAFNGGTKKAYFGCVTVSDAGIAQNAGIAVVDDTTNAVIGNIATRNIVSAMGANSTTKKAYAAEGDTVDVIDSTADTFTTVKLPRLDAGLESIAAFAVDETHDKVYVLAGVFGSPASAFVHVLDGASGAFTDAWALPIGPGGMNAIAVDPTTQKVFVVGTDATYHASIVTVDGTNGAVGAPSVTTYSFSMREGIVSIGNNNAAVSLLDPGGASIVQYVDPIAYYMPSGFFGTGIAVPISRKLYVFITGNIPATGEREFVVIWGNGVYAVRDDAPDPQYLLGPLMAGGSAPSGDSFYVQLIPDPTSAMQYGPSRVTKVNVTK